jgi:hypothetical protein
MQDPDGKNFSLFTLPMGQIFSGTESLAYATILSEYSLVILETFKSMKLLAVASVKISGPIFSKTANP